MCVYVPHALCFIYRKQWIKVLRVERDVPRHYRICR